MGPNYSRLSISQRHVNHLHLLVSINDYGIEGINTKSDTLYAVVQSLKKDGKIFLVSQRLLIGLKEFRWMLSGSNVILNWDKYPTHFNKTCNALQILT